MISRSKRVIRRRTVVFISLLILLLDQASKIWARSHLLPNLSQPFLPGLLQLRLVRNTGAAFSMLSDSTALLGLLSLLVSLGLLVWIWRSKRLDLWLGLALACLLGGTLGNGIDRWQLGYVTDFIELVPFRFPIFNGADIAINLAVLCFAIDALSQRHGQAKS